MLIVGGLVGLAIGIFARSEGVGCLALMAIPVGIFAYVWVWQGQNPDSLRSTSALDFLFVPLWPSLGAIGGYVGVRVAQSLVRRLDRPDP